MGEFHYDRGSSTTVENVPYNEHRRPSVSIQAPIVDHGWRLDQGGYEPEEVYPVNDLKPHVLGGKKPCWCNPFDDEGTIVHNAMDGREAFEEGLRKPS
jgi:hypothetical protein